MPWFALNHDLTEYEIDPGQRLPVHRPVVDVHIESAGRLKPYCFFDTGAPFSVISSQVAVSLNHRITPVPIHGRSVPVYLNGTLTRQASLTELLTWWDPLAQQAIPCLLGEVTVRFRTSSGQVSQDLTLLAKVLQAPAKPYSDLFVMLGMHLLAVNEGKLDIQVQPWGIGGQGLFFPP